MLHLSQAWLLPQANADPSVINCLHNLSRRIATVLQHEERRCQYLTREAKLILALQDEVSAVADGESSRRLSYPTTQSRQCFQAGPCSGFEDTEAEVLRVPSSSAWTEQAPVQRETLRGTAIDPFPDLMC